MLGGSEFERDRKTEMPYVNPDCDDLQPQVGPFTNRDDGSKRQRDTNSTICISHDMAWLYSPVHRGSFFFLLLLT